MKCFVQWFFSGVLVFVVFSCTIKDKKQADTGSVKNAYAPFYDKIKEGRSLLKDGDLVLRSGQEFSSQLIKQFNRHDKTWSHSGIVFYDNGYPFVYHIVPGDENPDEKLKKDSLDRFCNPRKNFGFAIYRYNMDEEEIKKFRTAIDHWYQKEIVFDSLFNMRTDDKMYCSEMIKKGLAIATGDRIILDTTEPTEEEAEYFAPHLKVDARYLSKLDIVSIDNLFINPHCRLIKRFDFIQTP